MERKLLSHRAESSARRLPSLSCRSRSLLHLSPYGTGSWREADRHLGVSIKLACERDLEGIVAKHRQGRYAIEDGGGQWIKIKNRKNSQLIGRDELFERRYEAAGALEIGWDVSLVLLGWRSNRRERSRR